MGTTVRAARLVQLKIATQIVIATYVLGREVPHRRRGRSGRGPLDLELGHQMNRSNQLGKTQTDGASSAPVRLSAAATQARRMEARP